MIREVYEWFCLIVCWILPACIMYVPCKIWDFSRSVLEKFWSRDDNKP